MQENSQDQRRTIKPKYVTEMMAGYVSQGGDVDALLTSLGFTGMNQMSNQLISVSEFSLITQAIEQALQDEMLGFFHSPAAFGSRIFINRTLTQLSNLRAAVCTLNDFYTLLNRGHSVLTLIDTPTQAALQLLPQQGLQGQSTYFRQRLLLTSYKKLCWLAKTRLPLQQVEFSFPVRNSLPELQHVFGCQNIMQSQHCRLVFEDNPWDNTIVQDSSGAEQFANREGFYTLLWPNLDTLDISIRLLIGKDISNGFPSFDSIAAQLKISPQTLSRRLQQDGRSYQSIKDDIRRETALALLNHSNHSIKEIAFTLGFQESSAFSKTFKKWFGMTASQYRQKQGQL